MQVENGKLGVCLLGLKLELPMVQMILSYVKSFGKYEDDDILVVVDVENGGYFVENINQSAFLL